MSEPIDARIGNLARRLKPDQTMTMPASQVLAMLAALEHAERAVNEQAAKHADCCVDREDLDTLRTRLAEAEQNLKAREDDNVLMAQERAKEVGQYERLLTAAEQRGRDLSEAIRQYHDLWILCHEREEPPSADLIVGLGYARGDLFAALTPGVLSAPPPGDKA